MSRICQLTGKKAMKGNNVSFSNAKTPRQFKVNLKTKKFRVQYNYSLKMFAFPARIALTHTAHTTHTHTQQIETTASKLLGTSFSLATISM